MDLMLDEENKVRMIPAEIRLYFFKQILLAVFELHNVNGIAHIDLKPENMVITLELKIALIDFACSTSYNQRLSDRRGTFQYMAPEVKGVDPNAPYHAGQADLFSLGVCLFVILF